jgi:hypothetical protein
MLLGKNYLRNMKGGLCGVPYVAGVASRGREGGNVPHKPHLYRRITR